MPLKNLSEDCALPQQTIKLFKSEGFIDGFASSQEIEAKIIALKYLLMSRFSLEQIKAMHSKPSIISLTVKEHIFSLSSGERSYPSIVRILSDANANKIQDVFTLGSRMADSFLLSSDELQAVLELKNSCSEIEALLLEARDFHRAETGVYPITMVPLIGFPFALYRSHLLSQMGERMNKADELCRSFTEALTKIEPFLDFSSLSYHYVFEGRNYAQASPNATVISYSIDVDEKFSYYWERFNSIKNLLEGLKFYSEAMI